MRIIRYTNFRSIQDGNGAERHTAQITEVLKEAGIETDSYIKEETARIPLYIVIKRAIPVIRDITRIIPLRNFKSIKSVLRGIRDYIRTEQQLLPSLRSTAGLILWECTRNDNFFVPVIAKKYKKKIIAFSHNLESLVPLQVSSISLKKSPDWFNEEVSYLSASDKVFCVSKEETLLLKLLGIEAYYYPYFPTKEIELFYKGIKEKRKTRTTVSGPLKLLMMGSANNPPTRIGMMNRIQFFSSYNHSDISLTIAGFCTQTLSEDIHVPSHIKIAGSLTNMELEQELIEADAILIHQPATSGALTRIPEMLLAGIPIILNFESARNFYNLDGIYIYQDDKSLMRILSTFQNRFVEAKIYPPVDEIENFIQVIKSQL